MTTTNTAGLAASHQWDTSTSWSASSWVAIDTAGRLGYVEIEYEGPVAEEGSASVEPLAPMERNRAFHEMTERGLQELREGRFRVL